MTDKLPIFLDAITALSDAQIAAIESNISGETAALEAQAEKKAEAAAAAWTRSEREHIRAAAAQQTVAREGQLRRALLSRREEYADEVFAAVRERIAAFTASAEYPAHLAALLEKGRAALGEGKTAIYLRREDMHLGAALRKKCPNAELREGDFALGGLWLSVDARRADMSFDTALDGLRSRFAEIIGMEIEP